MSTSAQRNEDRLSGDDRATILDRMAATYNAYRPTPRGAEVIDTLERVGAHSVGCSIDDLRDSERAWIRSAAAKLTQLQDGQRVAFRTVRGRSVACVVRTSGYVENGQHMVWLTVTATKDPVYRRGEIIRTSANWVSVR